MFPRQLTLVVEEVGTALRTLDSWYIRRVKSNDTVFVIFIHKPRLVSTCDLSLVSTF